MSTAGGHILYVITDLGVGGVPLHLHRLVMQMRTRGYQTTVVSLALPGPVGDQLELEGVAVHGCGGRGGRDFRVIGRLAQLLRLKRPDVVHAMLFHANFAARRAGKKAGIPRDRILCEIQTVEVERRWHLWVDRFTHRGCRLTIGNSPSVIEHLHAKAEIPRNRLRLVRGGIDPKRIADAPVLDRATLPAPMGAKLMLWTGRLDPIKGLGALLAAVARLEPDVAAHLLLAGDGPLRAELEQQAAALGIRDRTHFLGVRRDVPSLLKAVDLFVFPSLTEGLPNALLEAMAAGCPIVTTDAPGCRDLIEHDRTGLVVPCGDTSSLARAIHALLSDNAKASRLGEAAKREVSEHWHIRGTYDHYEALYREVLGHAGDR